MTKILVTGFGPFGALRHNPSGALLRHLPAEIDGASIDTATLPVETRAVRDLLPRLYSIQPDVVLHTGLAFERPCISIERVALNVLDFPQPDNEGQSPRDEPVVPGGPLALAARLPLRAILSAWAEAGIAAQLSDSAGTFLCNQVMYLGLHLLPQATSVGFIHLPPDEVLALQAPRPHQSLALQVRALRIALGVVLSQRLPASLASS